MPKTSERVVDTLIEAGVTHAFTLPGLGITWSLPAFEAQRNKIDVVLPRSEWIASVMAQATGRLTGRPAVLIFGPHTPYMDPPGPGATILHSGRSCSPCRGKLVCDGRIDCMNDIRVARVLAAVEARVA